jgi:hypothetical protein
MPTSTSDSSYDTSTSSDHIEEMSFFCSLICFVPWSQVICMTETENAEPHDSSFDEGILLDDYSISSSTLTSSTSLSVLSSSLSSSSSYQALSNENTGTLNGTSDGDGASWSVFKSRRRNSGNVSKDFSDHSPIKTHTTIKSLNTRTSPVAVTHHPQYFDIKGL